MAQTPFRIRGAGRIGIITDAAPEDLPINAFTRGNNVRFDGRAVRRAPVFRLVDDAMLVCPAFLYSIKKPDAPDTLLYAAENGKLYLRTAAGGHLDVTPEGFVPSVSTAPFTAGTLGNVAYINRRSDQPFYLGPTADKFAPLPGWDASWRCRSLRPFLSYMVALYVSKGGVLYPQMVKWSHPAQTGLPPETWDHLDTTKAAGENLDIGSATAIVDGLALGNTFFIYTEDEIWAMPHVGGGMIFDFYRMAGAAGAINVNCVVEVNNRHFVFGPNDIYVWDGAQKQSLTDGRVQEYIYSNLDYDKRHRCFVAHNEALSEIWFAYASNDQDAVWEDGEYPNRAAVYNYAADTWSFMDLPNVSMIVTTELEFNEETYDNTSLKYTSAGASYASLLNTVRSHVVAGGAACSGLQGGRIWGVEPVHGPLAALAKEIDPETIRPAYVERKGIFGDPATYKRLYGAYPLLRVLDYPVTFSIGVQKSLNMDPQWNARVDFTPENDQYRLHKRTSGRFLGYRMETRGDEPSDFEFTGLDLDVRLDSGEH